MYLGLNADDGSDNDFKRQTTFYKRAGLADLKGISFEMASRPEFWLSVTEDKRITLVKYEDTDAFRTSATFYPTPSDFTGSTPFDLF